MASLSNLEWLALSSNELSGEISSELGSLSNLERLDLSLNQLSGEIPAELGSFSNLEDLDLVASPAERGDTDSDTGQRISNLP